MRYLLLLLAACSVPKAHFDPDATASDGGTPPTDALDDAPPSTAMLSGSPTTGADFGAVALGGMASTASFIIANDGELASGPLAIALDDPGVGFAIRSDGCSGSPLPAHQTCGFNVAFAPAAAGPAATHVHASARPGGDVSLALSGTGLAPGSVDVMEDSFAFGTRSVDAAAQTHAFAITNRGQVQIGAPAATITGSTGAYAIDSTTCTQPLAPGAGCQVVVRFAPATVGSKPGSLLVTSNPGGSDAATLSGTGMAHVAVVRAGTGAGTVTSNQPGIDCGASCAADFTASPVSLSAAPQTGSTFTGWTGDCAGTGSCDLVLTTGRSVTATFTAVTPTLSVTRSGTGSGTVTSNPAGISCGAACSASFAFGTVVTLSASASSGSTFAGWSGACTGTGGCSVSMTQARAVTATFTATTPTLSVSKSGAGSGTVTSNPAGINCGATCSASFAFGTAVTLAASASSGSTFAGWSGACAGTGGCTVSMTQAQSVTASFTAIAPMLSVGKSGAGTGTVTSNPAGINCGATCSASFAFGTAVTLAASPSTGSTFAGWSGACTGTGGCSVSMTQAQSVTATFSVQTYPVAIDIVGLGTAALNGQPCGGPCSQSFAYGTPVTLSASPATGWMFAGWDDSTGTCSGTGDCFYTVTGPLTVVAQFTQLPHNLTVTAPAHGTVRGPSIVCGTGGSFCGPVGLSGTVTLQLVGDPCPSGSLRWMARSASGCILDESTQTCTVTMDADTNISASFTNADCF